MKKYLSLAICAMAVLFAGCEQNEPSDDKGSSSGSSYVVTGEAKDVTYKSVTLYGEVNVEISDYDEIEWGVMYSTDKNELESRNAERVFSIDDLLENVYSVSLSHLEAETKYYYCAFVYLNSKQYKFGIVKNFTTLEAPEISGIGIGVFSVSDSKAVTFSPGNLQYTQSTNTWSFAENQYDYIGTDNVTGGGVSSDDNGDGKSGTALADKIDLFGWSTSATYFGVSTSTDWENGYSGSFVDWGANKIGADAPNTWRTMTRDEWNYLLNNRNNASSLCGVAQVNGVNGLIFLPDNWTCPAGVTFKSGFHSNYGVDDYAAYQTFTADQWAKLEAAGAIFLPAAGYRIGSDVYDVQNDGYYWSATGYDGYDARFLGFDSDAVRVSGTNRYYGRSVRLVKDLQ